MKDLSVAAVICTKDRPVELARCLDSLSDQTKLPDIVVVVDSSAEVDDWRWEGPQGVIEDYLFIRSTPGLTHQRNVALDWIKDRYDVVAFLDDDAVVERNYLAAVVAGFHKHPRAVGVAGSITNLPNHRLGPWDVRFGLDGTSGRLLASGINVLAFPSMNPYRVEWISGCCMSYRSSAVQGLRFDEARNGNGLGEDVDFSSRAGELGELWFLPDARVRHDQSQINREAVATVYRRAVIHRWKLADEGIGGVRKGRIVFAIAAGFGRSAYLASRSRRLAPLDARVAEIRGLVDAVVRRRHRKPTMYV